MRAQDRNYKKVPVAVFHGAGGYPVRVNGSGGIASKLLTLPSAKDLPPSFASPEALEWLTWCDNVLAVRIYPALTDGFGNSVKAFSYLDGVDSFSTIEKVRKEPDNDIFPLPSIYLPPSLAPPDHCQVCGCFGDGCYWG